MYTLNLNLQSNWLKKLSELRNKYFVLKIQIRSKKLKRVPWECTLSTPLRKCTQLLSAIWPNTQYAFMLFSDSLIYKKVRWVEA